MLLGLIAGALLILVGAGAVWGTTAAAAHGRLRRNGWIGIRMVSTEASDTAWLAGHRAALPLGRATGVTTVILGLAMIVDGALSRNDKGSILLWVLLAVGYGGVLMATIVMAIRAHRAATQR